MLHGCQIVVTLAAAEAGFGNNYRSKKSEIGLLWNDPKLKIKWPKKKLIISKKDKNNLKFNEFCRKYKI